MVQVTFVISYSGEYTVIFDGYEYSLSKNDPLEIPYLLEPGSYTYCIYNNTGSSAKVSTNNTSDAEITYDSDSGEIIASVELERDGTIFSAASDLYFNSDTSTFVEDTDYTIVTTLYPITRDLNIALELDGDSNDQLSSVTATLSGVASKWDCINGVPYGGSVTSRPEFEIVEDDGLYYIKSSIKLLGVDGGEQILSLEMNYLDGNPATHTITSDLSAYLVDFNSDKTAPLELSNRYNVPDETAIGGVITGWSSEDGVDVDVK